VTGLDGEATASRPAGHEARWAAAAALTVLAALGALLVGDHRYLWYGDTPAAYYGWWYHLGELVRHGQWATIDPAAWRAGNLAAEGQWGLWSPLTIGIGLLTTVVPALLVTTAVVKLGLVAIAVTGVYLLARSYDAPPAAAYVAGVLAPMGGMTQYLDLPSWAAGEMIWALLPWAWWALRRTALHRLNPLPVLVAGYLLVSVGYVFGTIMLVVVLLACLLDCAVARDRGAALRVVTTGVLLGLVAVTVYLPGVLTASVTARAQPTYTLNGDKFTTDPLALLGGVLPTGVVPDTHLPLLPYTYLLWLLPVVLWLDWSRVRRGWRPLGGLALFVLAAAVMVAGPSQVGPLRYPLRLQPFLVLGLAVLVPVAWSRFRLARPSRTRLALSWLWVGLAAAESVLRASSQWAAQVCSAVLVAAALWLLWWLVRAGRRSWLAPVAGAVTLAAFGVQHGFFSAPPSPQRNAPTELAAYQDLYPRAVGDLMQVGDSESAVRSGAAAARGLPVGSAWYLTHVTSQSTYTAISHAAYKDRYCVYYQGSSCPQLLGTLFSVEPTTGRERVDLLGVSSLLLVRGAVPATAVAHPPAGWQVAERSRYAVLWTRTTPVAGAGSVAWTSPGTVVSHVHVEAGRTTFRVDGVASGGGTVVLRLLDWPGYTTSVGSLADPTDGYLLTVHLPPSAQGHSATVGFRPPAWDLEVAAWVVALVGGAAWSAAAALRRGRRRRESR
jgi:hypothetical protein